MKFTLYSRSYCHLCDDMLQALQAFGVPPPYSIDVVDVDANLDLVARYDELVPVLLGQRSETDTPVQLCHYFLDPAALRTFLDGKL
ncbi:MAG: glutaredoxin family protein [Burkholderiaceae bacterium]|nr:glutaredoxin family protein [Burkholderiaceae bacterium]